MANNVDPDQTAPGSMLFASILNSSVMLGNYLQQTTFSDAFFSWRLTVNTCFGFLQSMQHIFLAVLLSSLTKQPSKSQICQ